MIGLLFIIGFVTAIMLPFFFFLQYMGWFRSDPLEEIVGLDLRYTGSADHALEPIAHGHLTHSNHLLRVLHEVKEEENEDDLVTGGDDIDGSAGHNQEQGVNNAHVTILKEEMNACYDQYEDSGQYLAREEEFDQSMRMHP
jgi:hypothetical protein